MNKYSKSPLLYTGDKYKLLPKIYEKFDKDNENIEFVDLFCGGGSVGINSKFKKIILNDKNKRITNLHKFLISRSPDEIMNRILKIKERYGLLDSKDVSAQEKKKEPKKYLAFINKESFERLKHDYNINHRTDYLLTLIMYSFNHQIRFNKKNEFNLPVGNLGIPNNYFELLENYCSNIKNREICINNISFENLIKNKLKSKLECIFYFDPPYSNTLAQYNDNWNSLHDERIIKYAKMIDELNMKFIISNVSTNTVLLEGLKDFNVDYIEHTHISHKENKKVIEILIYN